MNDDIPDDVEYKTIKRKELFDRIDKANKEGESFLVSFWTEDGVEFAGNIIYEELVTFMFYCLKHAVEHGYPAPPNIKLVNVTEAFHDKETEH